MIPQGSRAESKVTRSSQFRPPIGRRRGSPPLLARLARTKRKMPRWSAERRASLKSQGRGRFSQKRPSRAARNGTQRGAVSARTERLSALPPPRYARWKLGHGLAAPLAVGGRSICARAAPSPHFSHSMPPALLFRRGRYGIGAAKSVSGHTVEPPGAGDARRNATRRAG